MVNNRVSIITAASSNYVIGKDGDLPWNLPSDLKYFKEITQGHSVIMGRKSWESIPEKFRPLPNRKNIIITRNSGYSTNLDALVRNDLRATIEEQSNIDEEVFIIGGSEIYKEAFKFVSRVYLTRVFEEFDGDTFLEGFNEEEWLFISHSDTYIENGLRFRFEIYDRV